MRLSKLRSWLSAIRSPSCNKARHVVSAFGNLTGCCAIRDLIEQMGQANFLWGAPRIHGELLKLGIQVAPSTVGKYLRRRRNPPSQTWRTFLTNHMKQMVSMDFFTVPTATFRVLFVFIVLSHDRRRVMHFNVTDHPSEEWTAQ